MLYHMYTCTINVYKSIYVCYTQNSINVTIISTRSLSFGHHRRLQHLIDRFVCVLGGGGIAVSQREEKEEGYDRSVREKYPNILPDPHLLQARRAFS